MGAIQQMLIGSGSGAAGIDPFFANVVSLLHFDGADGSTTFTDQKGKVWTSGGNAQIDTAQFQFGTASLLLDGTGDIITSPNSSDWEPGIGDFTVECWVRHAAIANQTYFTHFSNGGGNGGLFVGTNASGQLKVSRAGIADIIAGSGTAVPVGAWAHVAFCRGAGTLRTFLNGVVQDSVANASNIADSGTNLGNIGGFYTGAGGTGTVSSPMNGWMDEFRFTNGVARYTANFTPPTGPFPNS